jgi:uncharacterized membrane protein YgdD (TMEM256/DUF423 family)
MQKRVFITASISAGIAVALGAFGAHGLETLVEQGKIAETRIATWHTAVQYQFYHAIALCIVAFAYPNLKAKTATIARYAFIAGILLFSGSLYLMTVSPLLAGSEIRWLGAITPLGGIAFITGWICLVFAIHR